MVYVKLGEGKEERGVMENVRGVRGGEGVRQRDDLTSKQGGEGEKGMSSTFVLCLTTEFCTCTHASMSMNLPCASISLCNPSSTIGGKGGSLLRSPST